MDRRTSIKSLIASFPLLSPVHAAAGASRPRVAFIGCGGRAKGLYDGFREYSDVRWVCDPDGTRLQEFKSRTKAEYDSNDMRRALDDSQVDAVVIATPDHWHAPAALLALAAGKHVYVEKPCSHNLVEGQQLVQGARKTGLRVQHGTQSRTSPMIAGAIQMLREGLIGEVISAKAWNVQRRRDIGKAVPTEPPPGVDYETWIGPAEYVPYQKNRFHYDWHWWYNFGTGDIGNDGAHEMDMARWGLGVKDLPTKVMALGGKYFFNDEQQFPDTATCVFEWSNSNSRTKQLVFEMRLWSKNYPHNCDSGVEFYGTQGMMFVSKRGKLQVWNDSNQLLVDPRPQRMPQLPANHQVDFLQAIEQSRPPAAEIAEGNASVALIHLANISVRLGQSIALDGAGNIVDNPNALALASRSYREHWGTPLQA